MNRPERRPRVLVSAASGHGSTTEIARVIGGTLADNGIAVDIVPPAAVDFIEDYDAVILGTWCSAACGDFRDWEVITQWADGIAADLAALTGR